MMDHTGNQNKAVWAKGFALLVFCLFLVSPLDLSAAPPAAKQSDLPKSCDADFMTKMTNRAAAEAARDTVLAQTAIRKADSVLEYSCFSQLAALTANVAAKLFTETTYWKDGAGKEVDISSMDEKHSPSAIILDITAYQPIGTVAGAINDIVFDALSGSGHITKNFGHGYLGVNATKTAGGTPSPSGGSVSYNCSDMQIVWHVSKCDAFLSEDLFTKIGQNDDIRQYPDACTGGTGFAGIDIKAPSDLVVTHLQKIHRDAPNVKDCAQQMPILTGRMIEKVKSFSKPATGASFREVLESPEKICLLPGCYYDYVSDKCAE